jgi:hypothetical protein
MTTQDTTRTTLDASLFDRLRELFARPDMIAHCQRATAPARHHTRRAFHQDTDFRSWRD